MKINDLPKEQIDNLCNYRCDWFVEKHEGPWIWSDVLKWNNPEFLNIEGYAILLPLDTKHHQNITILRCIPSQNDEVITIFLKDTTYYSGIDAGFLAICERVFGEKGYLATVYHEWYLVEKT